jgi:hypothetical protein
MKNLISTKFLFSFANISVLAFAIYSCTVAKDKKLKEKIAVIKPPFEGVDVPMNNFSFDASKDAKIETKEGTIITIPANSLVDSKGKKVKGKVDLTYRSINSPAEIIASGIPMTYDSSGVSYDFISAGMFEIGANQGSEKLEIAKGKNIDVDFASYKSGNDFSFYKIDQETGKWDFKGISTPKVNQRKKEKLKLFEDDNLFQLEVDYSTHDELKPFDGLKWLCLDEYDKNNPARNKWVLEEAWFDVSLSVVNSKKGIYKMTLSNSEKTISINVSPYLLENESTADITAKINTLNEKVKEKKEKEAQIQMEADILRNYKISSFGLYNWDKIDKLVETGELAVTDANFLINSKGLEEDAKIFHFSGKDKLLSRVSKKWDKLIFDPKGVNKILVVLAGNLVAISEYSEFLKARGSKNFQFNLRKRAKKINSIADIDAILAE